MKRRIMPRLKVMPRLLVRFWLSYAVLIAILLCVVGIPLYFGGYSLLSQEAYSTAENDLNSFSQTINTRLREMDRIAVQLSSNEKMIPYFLAQGGFYVHDAVNELDKIRRSNDFIYDVIVYYTPEAMKSSGQGLMVGASGSYRPEAFFDIYYRYEGWNMTLFRQEVAQTVRPIMRPVERVWQTHACSGRFLTYLCPLLFNLTRNERGVVMFLIQEEQVNAIIDHASLHKNGMTSIYDGTGRLLFAANRLTAGGEIADWHAAIGNGFAQQPGQQDILLLREPHKQITIRSPYNNWMYVGILPKSILFHKVYTNLQFLLYLLGIALLLGFAFAWLLSVSNYRPIKSLRAKLAVSGTETGPGDDLTVISRTVDTLWRNNESLILQLKSQQDLARIQILQNLLASRYASAEDVRASLQTTGTELPYNTFNVIIYSIDDYPRFALEYEKAMQDLLRFAMLNVIEELSSRTGCKGYGIDSLNPRQIILIINYDDDHCDESFGQEISRQYMDFFRQNFKCSFTAGIGRPCHAILQIPLAYAQAAGALSRQFLLGKGILILWQDSELLRLTRYWYPVDDENRLLSAIRQGNGVEAEQTVHDLVTHLITGNLPVQSVRFVLSTLMHRILVVITDMNLATELPRSLSGLEQDTIWEWRDLLAETLWPICRQVRTLKESHNFALKDQLIAYIQSQYARNDLSLQLFAEKFGLSPGYITRFFKNQTGVPLMLYLDQVRLQHAARMLLETGLSLREIITRCGYLDETNFIRKFKRQHGQTPMQYRRSYQLEQNRSDCGDA